MYQSGCNTSQIEVFLIDPIRAVVIPRFQQGARTASQNEALRTHRHTSWASLGVFGWSKISAAPNLSLIYILGFMSCLSVTTRFLHVLNRPSIYVPVVLTFMFDDLPLADSVMLKAKAHTKWFIIILSRLSHHEPMDVPKIGAKYPVNLFQQQLRLAQDWLVTIAQGSSNGPKEVDDKMYQIVPVYIQCTWILSFNTSNQDHSLHFESILCTRKGDLGGLVENTE